MFDYKHYVPILRWKAAEKDAISKISPEEKKFITPLIEFLMPQPKQVKPGEKVKNAEELLKESIVEFQRILPELPEQILKYWGRSAIFIDVSMIDGTIRSEVLLDLLTVGEKMDLFMIPVVNIIPVIDFESDIKTRNVAIKFAKESKRGLCLRLSSLNIKSESLVSDVEHFIKKTTLKEKDIDIIIDFKTIKDGDSFPIQAINRIPSISNWRTFTVASGAFPPDLSKFDVGKNYTDRSDWKAWINEISSKKLKRKPSFGDYTILHPIYKEPVRGAIPSASIRYTVEEKWLIMRGQGGRTRNTSQYLANAQLLSKESEFSGAAFSYGDQYILEKGKDLKNPKTGSPRTWLVAGINHHLMKVISQISSLVS